MYGNHLLYLYDKNNKCYLEVFYTENGEPTAKQICS